MEQAELLLDRGLHPRRVSDGFEVACKVACDNLDAICDTVHFRLPDAYSLSWLRVKPLTLNTKLLPVASLGMQTNLLSWLRVKPLTLNTKLLPVASLGMQTNLLSWLRARPPSLGPPAVLNPQHGTPWGAAAWRPAMPVDVLRREDVRC